MFVKTGMTTLHHHHHHHLY